MASAAKYFSELCSGGYQTPAGINETLGYNLYAYYSTHHLLLIFYQYTPWIDINHPNIYLNILNRNMYIPIHILITTPPTSNFKGPYGTLYFDVITTLNSIFDINKVNTMALKIYVTTLYEAKFRNHLF